MKLRKAFPIIFFVVVILAFSISMHNLSTRNDQEEKATLEQALTRYITQCYALEGTYPPNLAYLKDHYGLTYNEEHYFVDYQYIGGNLRPDVTIIER